MDAGGRATLEQLPRMRGYEIRQLAEFDPLTPTLSRVGEGVNVTSVRLYMGSARPIG
jgi:hypothetical protein